MRFCSAVGAAVLLAGALGWPASAAAVEADGVADADALRSAACRAALGRLDVQEAREAAVAPGGSAGVRAGTPSKALQRARRDAAEACLGGAAAAEVDAAASQPPTTRPVPVLPPLSGRAAAPPVVVPRVPPAAPLALPPPVPVPAPPPFVTACDATGCWSSDGHRLDRVGPDLYFRDRRLCDARGGLLHCP